MYLQLKRHSGGKNVRTWDFHILLMEMLNDTIPLQAVWQFFKNFRTHLSCHPAILLDIYLPKMKAYVHTKIFILIHGSFIYKINIMYHMAHFRYSVGDNYCTCEIDP